jgi:tryptophan 2,3-dioxygenase
MNELWMKIQLKELQAVERYLSEYVQHSSRNMGRLSEMFHLAIVISSNLSGSIMNFTPHNQYIYAMLKNSQFIHETFSKIIP